LGSACIDIESPVIYPLSLPDALPLSFASWSEARRRAWFRLNFDAYRSCALGPANFRRDASPGVSKRAKRAATDANAKPRRPLREDRKSTRLNSSHVKSSYAVFCLKKK